jgi:hypothetical protein
VSRNVNASCWSNARCGLQQAFNNFLRDCCRVLLHWQFDRPCPDRISPDQGCLEIAVMLEESPRFRRMAAAARRNVPAIVFFDRCTALIRVFAIGAYKPV